MLENAIVRAAAVNALARFGIGQKDAEVKRSIGVLLSRCLDDLDDEVRDRTALNLRLMDEEDETAIRFVSTGKYFLRCQNASTDSIVHRFNVLTTGI